MQADLFDRALNARDRGMRLAADAEDRSNPGFSEAALAVIRAVAGRQEFVHVDDILPAGLRPDHPNCWGAVWLRAIRQGIIERTGTIRQCRSDAGKHAHSYPVYRSRIYS
jgi:hypothetical protein